MGGCPGQSSTVATGSLTDSTTSNPPGQFKTFVCHRGITNTQELVGILNDLKIEEEKDALMLETLRVYVGEVSDRQRNLVDHGSLKEFSALGQLRPESEEAKKEMRNSYFAELIRRCNEMQDTERMMEIVLVALRHLDVGVFDKDPQKLLEMARVVSTKIKPANTSYGKEASPWQCQAINALRLLVEMFDMIENFKPTGDVSGTLFGEIKENIDDIVEKSSACFPMHHYASLLQCSIDSMLAENTETGFKSMAVELWDGAKDCSRIWNVMVCSLTFRFDLASLDAAGTSFRRKIFGRSPGWCSIVQYLNGWAICVAQNEANFETYISQYEWALKGRNADARKHVMYGIIDQLTMVALTESCSAREQARRRLNGLKEYSVVSKNENIEAYLDSRLDLLKTETSGHRACTSHSNDQAIEVQARGTSDASSPCMRAPTLFFKICPFMCNGMGHAFRCSRKNMLDALRQGYQENLHKTTSPIDREEDVSAMTFHLTKRRSSHAPRNRDNAASSGRRNLGGYDQWAETDLDGLMEEIEGKPRVLVKGMPGIGKSTLAQTLAFDWSNGNSLKSFDSVFLLSVSDVSDTNTDGRGQNEVIEAIVESCSKHGGLKCTRERIRMFVKQELKETNKTLVILDGVEATKDFGGIVEAILHQSSSIDCHMLLFGRPNVEEYDAGSVFTLHPLSEEAVKNYLSPYPKLKARMVTCPHLLEVHRNPLHLRALLREAAEIENEDCQKTTSWFYDNITQFILKTYNAKHRLQALIRNNAYNALGKAALAGLKKGSTRIKETEVPEGVRHLCSDPSLFDTRGLILYHDDTGDIEFTHSTLQQFFAGHHLAALISTMDKTMDLRKYIKDLESGVKYGEVLKTAAAELGQAEGDGIDRLLGSLCDEDRICNAWNLNNRMRCLQQYILQRTLNADEFEAIDQTAKILSSMTKCLEEIKMDTKDELGSDALLIAVISLLKKYPHVVAHLKPHLLDIMTKKVIDEKWDVTEHVIEAVAWIIHSSNEHNEEWIAAVTKGLDEDEETSQRVLMQLRIMVAIADGIIPELLALLTGMYSIRENEEYPATVIELLRRHPQSAGDDIETLAEICAMESFQTREAIRRALPELLAADDRLADTLISKILKQKYDDATKLSVGEIETLGICLQCSPSEAHYVVDVLLRAWKPMPNDKRKAVAEAFVRIIRAKPNEAMEIVEHLLDEKSTSSWKGAVKMLKIVMTAAGSTPDQGNDVVRCIRQEGIPERDTIGLTLEAVKSIVKMPQTDISGLCPHLVRAFDDEDDWYLRKEAFTAVAAIAKHRQEILLGSDLLETIVGAIKKEHVFVARMHAFEAAAEILKGECSHLDLIQICQEGITDEDKTIRERAARALANAISSDIHGEDTLLHQLIEAFEGASDDGKHGMIRCLHFVIQSHPETTPEVCPILIEAVGSKNDEVLLEAISAIGTVLSSEHGDNATLIKEIKAAHIQTRKIGYEVVKALTICFKKDGTDVDLLISNTKRLPSPLNDVEREIYFRALGTAIETPSKSARPLMKALLDENSDDAQVVREKRRAAANGIPFHRWLEWYDVMKSRGIMNQICKRFYSAPGAFIKKKTRNQIRWHYVEDEMKDIDKELSLGLGNRIEKHMLERNCGRWVLAQKVVLIGLSLTFLSPFLGGIVIYQLSKRLREPNRERNGMQQRCLNFILKTVPSRVAHKYLIPLFKIKKTDSPSSP